MTDMYVPAPEAVTPEPMTVASTIPAAPAETVAKPSAETAETVTPQAETPAGTEDQQQAAPDQELEKKPSEAEINRKQRNQERWQRMKQETADSRRREQFYLGEIERLKSQKPDYSQITDPDDLLAEKTADKIRNSTVQDHEARANQERAVRDRAVGEAWNAIKDDMRAKMPDFDQFVNDQTPIHERAAPFIVESEKAGEIAYWLGKNPDAARDLFEKFQTAPAQALVELGRIEARLSAPSPKTVSTAPKPAPILSGGVSPLGFDVHKASVADTASMLRKAGLIR